MLVLKTQDEAIVEGNWEDTAYGTLTSYWGTLYSIAKLQPLSWILALNDRLYQLNVHTYTISSLLAYIDAK